jgi:hypothetical protein
MNIKLSACNNLIILLFTLFSGAGAANDLAPLDIGEVRITMSANVATGEGQCDGEEHGVELSKSSPSGIVDAGCATFDFLLSGNSISVISTVSVNGLVQSKYGLRSKAITPAITGIKPSLTIIIMDPAINTSLVRIRGSHGLIPVQSLGGEPVQFYSVGNDPLSVETVTGDFIGNNNTEPKLLIELFSITR